MANSRGSYRTTAKNSMAAFDKLPKSIREALHDAAFDYAPQPLLTSCRRGLKAEAIAKLIPTWDANKIEKDRKRVWGVDYPSVGAIRATAA